MADFVLRVGCHSAQGARPNNEDRYVVDADHHFYLVADGMGGQDKGEQASCMAAEIIPRVIQDRLTAHDEVGVALQRALAEANQAIIKAGESQPMGRRMGTTAVLALEHAGQVYVTGLGDSRAYLIHPDRVEQLTVDHSVANALVLNGALTPEEARNSPWQHVLHKFLGCATMTEGADIRLVVPQAGDRLLLGSDGLTSFLTDEDLLEGRQRFPDPQRWADHLVDLALERGSQDNVTCVVVAFEAR